MEGFWLRLWVSRLPAAAEWPAPRAAPPARNSFYSQREERLTYAIPIFWPMADRLATEAAPKRALPSATKSAYADPLHRPIMRAGALSCSAVPGGLCDRRRAMGEEPILRVAPAYLERRSRYHMLYDQDAPIDAAFSVEELSASDWLRSPLRLLNYHSREMPCAKHAQDQFLRKRVHG